VVGADLGGSSKGGSSNKTLAFVAFGVGGVGLLVGGVTGMIALSKHSDLNGKCPGGTCPDKSLQSDVDSYHSMGMISTIGFIAAGLGAAAGTVLLLTAPSDSARTSAFVTPYIGPGSVGATGRF
jgi:hypothetical protein